MNMKYFLTMTLALMMAMAAWAQGNRIYIEDFEICPDSTFQVPVMLANADSTRGLQFKMTLPEGLSVEEFAVTSYSRRLSMSMTCRLKDDGTYTVMIYPTRVAYYPPDTQAICLLTFVASSDFKGGDLSIWKCRGSDKRNMSFEMEGSTARVTVPASLLVEAPIDRKSVKDQYFNLMGVPISSPASAPVAIKVRTMPDGQRLASKMSVGH